MPTRPCPNCQTPTLRQLTGVSAIASVNYYRCEACGHVWTVPKDDPGAPPSVVTTETLRTAQA